jgi:hypothetical protein
MNIAIANPSTRRPAQITGRTTGRGSSIPLAIRDPLMVSKPLSAKLNALGLTLELDIAEVLFHGIDRDIERLGDRLAGIAQAF